MKRMRSKFFALLLLVSMMVSLMACGKDADKEKETTGTKSETNTQGTEKGEDSTAGGVDTSEHVVVTYVTTGNKPVNGKTEIMLDKLNAILTEKVNAEINMHYIEWTDYMTTYNLLLASGDSSIDLIGTATDWLDAWPNAKKGAFLKLTDDMLKTYAPQTYAQVSKEHWDMCKYNGDIYFIPEDNFAQWINHGFMYRTDWAKEFGLTNGVHNWVDLGKYFQGIKDNYPDVIPWDVAGSGSSTYITLSGGFITSYTDDIFIDGLDVAMFYGDSKDDPFTLVSPYMEGDEFVNYAKMMKEWADAGYWRTDVLNYTGETREEFYVGTTGADQHHTQTWYTQVRPRMDENYPGSDVEFFYFGEESNNLVKMSISHGAMAVSAFSANPERALMVYDLLRNDEECYRLFNYGIEGDQYIIDESGNLDQPEGYNVDNDSITTNFWWGRNDVLELLNASHYNEGKNEYADKYNQFAIDYPYSQLIFETDSITSYMSNMSDVYAQYLPLISFGKNNDPEGTVQEFRDAMNAAGYQTVKEELQKQLTAYKDVVGK